MLPRYSPCHRRRPAECSLTAGTPLETLRHARGPEEIAETSPDCTADSVPFDADLRLAGNDELRF